MKACRGLAIVTSDTVLQMALTEVLLIMRSAMKATLFAATFATFEVSLFAALRIDSYSLSF
jgi:hypothetical protein